MLPCPVIYKDNSESKSRKQTASRLAFFAREYTALLHLAFTLPALAVAHSPSQSSHFSAFLIDRGCQLEIDLTPAKSTYFSFLIVAEFAFCRPAFLRENLAALPGSPAAQPPTARLLTVNPQSKLVANSCLGGL